MNCFTKFCPFLTVSFTSLDVLKCIKTSCTSIFRIVFVCIVIKVWLNLRSRSRSNLLYGTFKTTVLYNTARIIMKTTKQHIKYWKKLKTVDEEKEVNGGQFFNWPHGAQSPSSSMFKFSIFVISGEHNYGKTLWVGSILFYFNNLYFL